jgi:NAD-dependent SIR2 family protein deacetylase
MQNVDGLHTRAGSTDVIELHGRTDLVRCLDCGYEEARSAFQIKLETLNPTLLEAAAELRADGDAELSQTDDGEFRVPPCPRCSASSASRAPAGPAGSGGGRGARPGGGRGARPGGLMKPDVVFFGDQVRAPVRRAADAAVDGCSGARSRLSPTLLPSSLSLPPTVPTRLHSLPLALSSSPALPLSSALSRPLSERRRR